MGTATSCKSAGLVGRSFQKCHFFVRAFWVAITAWHHKDLFTVFSEMATLSVRLS